jgi:hypothetical protein
VKWLPEQMVAPVSKKAASSKIKEINSPLEGGEFLDAGGHHFGDQTTGRVVVEF